MRKQLLALKNKIATYALIGGLGTSTLLTGCSNFEITPEDKTKIENEYGLESEELTVLTYIELSNKLHELNLKQYDENSTKKTNLDTPENIELNINQLDNIAYLKQQEENVNYYLRTEGYEIASNTSLQVLKSYIKQIMGLEQTENIKVIINTNNVDGCEDLIVVANEKQQNLKLKYLNKEAKQVLENYLITNVEDYEDINNDDNNKYNKDRNQIIYEALVESSELKKQIDKNNLTNSKLVRTLRKN